MRRKIAIITGSRADFGHLSDLIKAVSEDAELDLQFIVTGPHLSQKHGFTVREIEATKIPIAARVDMNLTDDSGAATAKSTGLATVGLAEVLEKLAPDLVVLLGDRFEILAAAVAALVTRIPIVHIHGGEVTTGAFDESIRHAISKMASLHLVAAEPYRRRLIQMGENPDRVFNMGAPGLDAIRRLSLLPRADLERDLGFSIGKPLVLMTFHPVTRGLQGSRNELESILAALDKFPQISLLITGTNADPDNLLLRKRLVEWSDARKGETHVVESLGHARYVSLVALADAMIGNSSSGYIEGPAFNLPVVDVGDRQTGRLAADCIQRVAAEPDKITAALARALDPAFRAEHAGKKHPYDKGRFAENAIALFKSAQLGPELLRKPFHDLPASVA